MPETQRLLDLLGQEQRIFHYKTCKSSQGLLNQYLSHAKVLICWLIYSGGSISDQWKKETEYSNSTIPGKRNSNQFKASEFRTNVLPPLFFHFDPDSVAWWRIRQSQVHWILTNVVLNTPIIYYTCDNCYQISTRSKCITGWQMFKMNLNYIKSKCWQGCFLPGRHRKK